MSDTTSGLWRRAGLPPGTLIHVGEKFVDRARITVIDYDPAHLEERSLSSVEECTAYKQKPTVTWLNVDGVHDVDLIRRIGECFGLHPLLLEDVANTQQRPKLEDYGDCLFLVVKMLYVGKHNEIKTEQVSIVVGRGFVLSFQEQPGDVFDSIRERLRTGKGRVRNAGADYLAYALIDAIVDNYFIILEAVGERIECAEEELVINPSPEILKHIRALKQDAMTLRRAVWPIREVINGLARGESPIVQHETVPYLRDAYSNTIQLADIIDTYRELIAGMRDTYLTVLSNRMNEVMKVLTIIATIFIPLTFVAGVYGMNFDFMPELRWKWGYPTTLALMAVIAGGMLLFFKRKKWL